MLSLSDKADVSDHAAADKLHMLEVILEVPIKVHKYWSSSFS